MKGRIMKFGADCKKENVSWLEVRISACKNTHQKKKSLEKSERKQSEQKTKWTENNRDCLFKKKWN